MATQQRGTSPSSSFQSSPVRISLDQETTGDKPGSDSTDVLHANLYSVRKRCSSVYPLFCASFYDKNENLAHNDRFRFLLHTKR